MVKKCEGYCPVVGNVQGKRLHEAHLTAGHCKPKRLLDKRTPHSTLIENIMNVRN